MTEGVPPPIPSNLPSVFTVEVPEEVAPIVDEVAVLISWDFSSEEDEEASISTSGAVVVVLVERRGVVAVLLASTSSRMENSSYCAKASVNTESEYKANIICMRIREQLWRPGSPRVMTPL